jgi:hypothetical protein
VLKKKNKFGGQIHKVIAIELVWHWWKNRHVDCWNRIESRNRPSLIWSADLWQRSKGKAMEQKLAFQHMILGCTSHANIKSKHEHTLHKNKLKMNQTPN